MCLHHKFVIFPFTAIVGQELMKKALFVNAIDPTIGGVLIRGDKGTGKSTEVRALVDLLPEIKVVTACPFNCHPENLRLMCKACQRRVEKDGEKVLPSIEKKMEIVDMPLSATEDMVIGAIDIKSALKDGMKALEPGILAKANRNILYIDEVNLLDDHLINILLDSAAMGVNIVEREGISLYHPARFILIGTMNPEEGDLRPQILDRFGLCVEVNALNTKEERIKVMEHRKEFDRDPWTFEERFRSDQISLRETITKAQAILEEVNVPKEMVEAIVDITTSLNIRTHRGDIILEKTARALAALEGKREVTDDNVKEAALLALPHRIRQLPFEKGTVITEETITTIMSPKQDPSDEEVSDFDRDSKMRKDVMKLDCLGSTQGKDFPRIEGNRGLYTRARPNDRPKSVAIDATMKRAVIETGSLKILPEHLMEKVRVSKGEVLYIILLDSSSSMRMEKKIRFAKTLAWQLLKRSYEKRNRVTLLSFRGQDAQVLVQPTSDLVRIGDALEGLPTGGKTPLMPALYKAFDIARRETRAKPSIILISDGRGNVHINGSLEEDLKFISGFVGNGTKLVMVNAESKNRSIGLLEDMAERFNVPHFYLEELV